MDFGSIVVLLVVGLGVAGALITVSIWGFNHPGAGIPE